MDDYGQSSGLSNFAFHELGRGAALAEQSTARVMVSVRNRLRGGGQGAPDLLLALQQAQENGRTKVTPMDLLICMLTASRSIVAECFERLGVTAAKLTEQAVIAEYARRDERG